MLLTDDAARKPGVLIVEDQSMVAAYLEDAVRESGRYRHAGTLSSASGTSAACTRSGVDLVLMDVYTALGADGIQAAAEVKRRTPAVKVVIVTSMPEASSLRRARQAGADSFWYKEGQATALLDVMDRTMAGESVYPDATPEVRIGMASSVDFTEREMDVLRALVRGLSNKEIAADLGIGAETVKAHVSSLLTKTGMKSRIELAVHACREGLVIPHGDRLE